MSFVAYCEITHINKKLAKDVQPKEQNNTFYCQNKECNCEYTVAALNSSKVKVHFVKKKSSSHIDGCWNNVSIAESGNKDNYDTSDFSPTIY